MIEITERYTEGGRGVNEGGREEKEGDGRRSARSGDFLARTCCVFCSSSAASRSGIACII